MTTRCFALLALIVTTGCGTLERPASPQDWRGRYPLARKGAHVDEFFGTKIPDPYRWLEKGEAGEVCAWTRAQNELARGEFEKFPDRTALRKRFLELASARKVTPPIVAGTRLFYTVRERGQDNPVVYRSTGDPSTGRVVLDPNRWSEGPSSTLSNIFPGPGGRLLAYTVADGGADYVTLRIRDVDRGEDLKDAVRGIHYQIDELLWEPDGSGLYYVKRRDLPGPGSAFRFTVFRHKLNTPDSDDTMVYEYREDQASVPYPSLLTEDGRFLVLSLWKSYDTVAIYVQDREKGGPFVPLLAQPGAQYLVMGCRGHRLFLFTNHRAPRGQVVGLDLDRSDPEPREVVPQEDTAILTPPDGNSSGVVSNRLVLRYMKDVRHVLRVFDLEGTFLSEIPLPAAGRVEGVRGSSDGSSIWFSFGSYTIPDTVYRYDLEAGRLDTLFAPDFQIRGGEYETRQVFCVSRDGTRVPMYLVHRKGLKPDGRTPTLLHGYGGFGLSYLPHFSMFRIPFLEAGGMYAYANIRGGGEFGRAWWEAGRKRKKQNVFDDFIAAAEWLIREGYTRPSRLAIKGGSNGGLLVAACMTQRPDLFGAVLCWGPVTDMVRIREGIYGAYLVKEFGDPTASVEDFRAILAYSPLQNVRDGVRYPATLVWVGENDSVAGVAHAKKFAATLQERDAGANPLLIYTEPSAGHGNAPSTSQSVAYALDANCFLFQILGMSYGRPMQ